MKPNNNYNSTDFHWISQILYECYESTNNVKLTVAIETGLSQELDNNIISYIPSRLTLKIKDMSTGAKNNIDLNFQNLFCLNNQLLKFNENSKSFLITATNKNKVRKLKMEPPSGKYTNLIIYDNSSVMTNINIFLDNINFNSFKFLINKLCNSWVMLTSNLQSTVTQHKMIKSIESIHIPTIPYILDHYEDNSDITITTTMSGTSYPHEEKIPDTIKDEIKNEDIAEEIIEDGDDDEEVPFDIDFNNIPETVTKRPLLEINDETLSNVVLDGEKEPTDYTIRKKPTISPRPFFNNFIDWNFDNLYNWVNAFLLVDSNSEDLTLTPLKLILTKSLNYEDFEFLYKNDYIHEFEYYLIDELKKGSLEYIQNNRFPTAFNDLNINDLKITKDNKNLYDFVIDIFITSVIFKIYDQNINKLKINDENNDDIYNIKITLFFISQICSPLFNLIDKNILDTFKEDALKVVEDVLNKPMIDKLSNIYEYATKGGTVNLNVGSFELFMDKFIAYFNNLNYKNIYGGEIEFKSVNDIREKLNKKIKKVKPKDSKIKLFKKCIEQLEYESNDYSELNQFSEIDIEKEQNLDVVEIYNIIKDNSDLKKVIQVKNLLNQPKEEIKEVAEEQKETKEENGVKGVWDIEDETDNFDIFDNLLQ